MGKGFSLSGESAESGAIYLPGVPSTTFCAFFVVIVNDGDDDVDVLSNLQEETGAKTINTKT